MTALPQAETAALLKFALSLAEAAEPELLSRFRCGAAVDNKLSTGFDPVTDADREAERVMRQLIERTYPDHGILGEEFGHKDTGSDFTWVLDPVDGTRAFICGLPTWTSLIGLTYRGTAVVGVMNQPYVGEVFYGSQEGAFCRHRGTTRRLSVRPSARLGDALGGSTSLAHYRTDEEKAYVEQIRRTLRTMRFDGDAYFYSLMAAGEMDLAMDAYLQPYDIVALIPIIEAAGGIVTTWQGDSAVGGGHVIATASAELHSEALNVLRRIQLS